MIKHPLGTTTPWGESCCGCFHWRRVRTSIPGEGESCPQLFLELVPSHFLELSQRGRTWARLWRAAFILGPKGGICELWPWRLETSPTQRSSQKSGNWQQVHHSTTVSDSQSRHTHVHFHEGEFSTLCLGSDAPGDPKPDDGQFPRDRPTLASGREWSIDVTLEWADGTQSWSRGRNRVPQLREEEKRWISPRGSGKPSWKRGLLSWS